MSSNQRLCGMIGLATKAGKVIFGCNLNLTAIRKGKKANAPKLVITACDASDNTKKRIYNCCTYYGIEQVITDMSCNDLSRVTGRKGLISCIGITDSSFSAAIKNNLNLQT